MLFSNDPLRYKVSSKIKLGKPLLKRYRHMPAIIFCICSIGIFYFYNYMYLPMYAHKAYDGFTVRIYNVIGDITDKIKISTNSVRDYIHLRDKYYKLKDEQNILRVKADKYDSLLAENTALKKLTKFSMGKLSERVIKSTRIIMKSFDGYTELAEIPIGSENNVRVGQVVISDNGVVGRIVNVTPNTSKVLLITSPTSQISGIFSIVRTKVMLSGNYNGKLIMTLLNGRDLPDMDELVVTSGDGGTFPPNLVIGRVTAVREGFIEVTPAYDVMNAHFVSVIDKYKD